MDYTRLFSVPMVASAVVLGLLILFYPSRWATPATVQEAS